MQRRLVIILGPTAVGKTDFSIGKAIEYGSPVISCDSRQIYKDMTIGTAVPDASQLAGIGDAVFKIQQSFPDYFTEDKLRELTGI